MSLDNLMEPSPLNPHNIKQKLVGGPFDGREYNFGKFTYSPIVEIRWHRSNAQDEMLLYEIQPDRITRCFIGSRPYELIKVN